MCKKGEIRTDYLENKFNFSLGRELKLTCCGKRIETPDHVYGPEVRDYFLIVSVKSGEAVLHHRGSDRSLCAGQILVMFPGENVFYEARQGSLWSINWIGVTGELVYRYLEALSITVDNPVYDVCFPEQTEEILGNIFELSEKETLSDKIQCMALVHQFFSVLAKNIAVPITENSYIRRALDYIRYNYDGALTVCDICGLLGLNRNYFSRLFKKEVGMTPVKYIGDLRFQRAAYLLRYTGKQISEIAAEVGLDDPLYFSRFFKAKAGVTPAVYRSGDKKRI